MGEQTIRYLAVASQKIADTAGSYYYSVFALTPKDTSVVAQQAQAGEQGPLAALFPSLAIYAPFVLFFALFIGAFGIQMISKAKSIKRMMTALVIALFAASIPFVLTATREGMDLRSKAGPEEQPQNLRIVQDSRTSALVTWATAEEKVGAVRIGLAPLTEKTSAVAIGDGGREAKVHQVKLENLQSGRTYELEILSGTLWYNDGGKPMKLQMK